MGRKRLRTILVKCHGNLRGRRNSSSPTLVTLIPDFYPYIPVPQTRSQLLFIARAISLMQQQSSVSFENFHVHALYTRGKNFFLRYFRPVSCRSIHKFKWKKYEWRALNHWRDGQEQRVITNSPNKGLHPVPIPVHRRTPMNNLIKVEISPHRLVYFRSKFQIQVPARRACKFRRAGPD